MPPEFGVAAVQNMLPKTGEFDFFRDEEEEEEELQFEDEDEIADQVLGFRSSFDTMLIAQPAAFKHPGNVSLTNDTERKQSVIDIQDDTQSVATSITPLWELLSGQQTNAEQELPGMHTPRLPWEDGFDTGQQVNAEEELPQVIVEEGLPGMHTPRIRWVDEFGTMPQMACVGLDPLEVEKEKNQLAAYIEMSMETVQQQPEVWDMDECDESVESDEMDDDESIPQRSAPEMVTPIWNGSSASSTTPRFDQSFEIMIPSTTFQPMIEDNQSDTEQFYDSDSEVEVELESDEEILDASDQLDQLFDASDQLWGNTHSRDY